MGQTDILEFLRDHNENYYTERELCEELNKSACRNALKSLRKYPPPGFEFRRVRNGNNVWTYVYKWRERLMQRA